MPRSRTRARRDPHTPSRVLVPVIGSGFNRWLLHGLDAPSLLHDWWRLLRTVAQRSELSSDSHLTAVLDSRGDAAFAWEALVRVKLADRCNPKATTSEVETLLLRELATLLENAEQSFAQNALVVDRWSAFSRAVWGREGAGRGPSDLLSLNFSIPGASFDSLHQPLPTPKHASSSKSTAEDASQESPNVTSRISIPSPVMFLKDKTRVWFPHGTIHRHETLVLGTHRYIQSARYVVSAFQHHKRMETISSSLTPTGNEPKIDARTASNLHRSGSVEELSWVSVALNAPLLLLGVGLDRTEVDIWEFLHLRARNHARLSEVDRPAIWRLTSDEESPGARAHWSSLSKGIAIRELNLGDTWSEAWANLLALLSGDSTLFGS